MTARNCTVHVHGWTLVELLVCLLIIGVLLQLAAPAIQHARESSRRTQCHNHLKQLSLGCLLHLETHGFLPTGGWSGAFTADESRGYGKSQPGGWAFSILSYIGENALRGLAQVSETAGGIAASEAIASFHASAPSLLYCPSRREPRAYPIATIGPSAWDLSVQQVSLAAPIATKSDYAANSGDAKHHAAVGVGVSMWTPSTTSEFDLRDRWTVTSDPYEIFFQTGVIYYRSEVKPSQITAGMSKTYLIGEKLLSQAVYEDVNRVSDTQRYADNQSAWAGYEWDNQRVAWAPGGSGSEALCQPKPDSRASPGEDTHAFGSAHPVSLAMAMCDGSLRRVAYDVDPVVHRQSAVRFE